jgi:predicted RNA-binding protein
MDQYWLVVGRTRNWEISFQNNNIWGLKDFRELGALWNLLREGDRILLYVSKPVSGIVGCGTVTTKFRQTAPLWPDEIRRNSVIWPLRFEFDLEYCLSPSLWMERAYRELDLQLITRMVFQCVPFSIVESVRKHFELKSIFTPGRSLTAVAHSELTTSGLVTNHDQVQEVLAEVGRLQGFLAEKEYPIDRNRLDVVWRRVERSVPTYAFEVQIGGDIYHALAKLKRAYELWNSRIFLVGSLEHQPKFDELVSGNFHEIAKRARFLEINQVEYLFVRKKGYRLRETELGLFPE